MGQVQVVAGMLNEVGSSRNRAVGGVAQAWRSRRESRNGSNTFAGGLQSVLRLEGLIQSVPAVLRRGQGSMLVFFTNVREVRFNRLDMGYAPHNRFLFHMFGKQSLLTQLRYLHGNHGLYSTTTVFRVDGTQVIEKRFDAVLRNLTNVTVRILCFTKGP